MASASVYTAVLAAAHSSEHSEHSILLPEPADLIWGSLCFVVIAVVLLKYALPKFTAILDERTAKIQAGLDFAEQAKSDRTRTQKEAAELVEGARRDAAALRDKAHGEAERILSQARTDAEGEADKALASSKRQLEAETSAVREALRSEVGLLATEIAEKLLRAELSDPKAAARLIDESIAQLETETSVR